MSKVNVTLRIEKNVYEKYKIFCSDNAIALSKSVENFMAEKISDDRKQTLR